MEILENIMADYGLSPLPNDTVEAMAYVPFQQQNSKTYSPAHALEAGTVYPVLDNDLARDNVENDLPAADLEDL